MATKRKSTSSARYKCNTCGQTYTAKTKVGHSNFFGHKSFTRTK